MPVICRLGGGTAAKPFAVIHALYTAGLVCTCQKGTTVLKSPDTSGECLFLIPEAGTWTVSDGRITKQVVITSRFQVEYINITEIHLYDNGDECADRTGGWLYRRTSTTGGGTLTKNSDRLTATLWYANTYGEGTSFVYTQNDVSIAGFSTLHARVKSNLPQARLVISSTPLGEAWNEIARVNIQNTGGSIVKYDLAIPSGASAAYPSIFLWSGDTVHVSVDIYEVWVD